MINIVITLALIICLLWAVVWKAKPLKANDGIFDKSQTTTLKGISSIIVIFVHIPLLYQNTLQDMVGSFAYVAVTCFFMISAYGMQYSLDNNAGYLNRFPVNRLAALLIPNIVINIVVFLAYIALFSYRPQSFDKAPTLSILWEINSYVVILLEYCLLFYIVSILSKAYKWKQYVGDIILITAVCGSSLFLYLSESESASGTPPSGWCYERLGLVWGLLLYRFYKPVCHWLQAHHVVMKLVSFTVSSLILGLLYLKYKECWFWGQYMLKIVLGLSIITVYLLITGKIRLFNPITEFLGKISYETYLAHYFIGSLLIIAFPQLQSGIYIWTIVVVTLLFSYFINKIDRRAVNFIKSLKLK